MIRLAASFVFSGTFCSLLGSIIKKGKATVHTKQNGFTIIELLIVIIVIGVLSALSYVAYTNVQSRSRTAVVTSALSQAKTKLEVYKVGQGAYPTTGNFSAAGIPSSPNTTYSYVSMDGNAYCLTATNSTITYGITNTTTPTEGGCGNTNWLGNVTLTNMVMNGDFSQGTAGWSRNASTYNFSVTNGVMSHTVTVVGGGDFLSSNTTFATPGNKYYVSVWINPFRTHGPRLYIGGVYALAPSSSAGSFTKASAVIVATGTDRLHLYANGGSATETVVGATTQYKHVVAIDLTTTFGPGNEPTREQMDAILSQFPNSYFNGTVSAH